MSGTKFSRKIEPRLYSIDANDRLRAPYFGGLMLWLTRVAFASNFAHHDSRHANSTKAKDLP